MAMENPHYGDEIAEQSFRVLAWLANVMED